MTKRLKYEKFNNTSNVLTIDLHNGYSVIAIVGTSDTNDFTATLFLKHNTVDDWQLVEKAEKLEFNATFKTINSAILSQVSKFLEEGFFDYYIERYEYYLKCFDKGNAVLTGEENV